MQRISLAIVTGILVLGLAGCAGQGEETATPEVALDFVPVVSVTGEVVPARWATISAQANGRATEVLVEPGDEVAEGDLLVRLDSTDAQLALQQAEAALEAARAQLALLEAPPLLQEVAAADAAVEAAQAALSQALAQRNELAAGAIAAEIAAASAEVAGADAARKAARIRYDDVRGDDVDDWIKEEAALRSRAAEQALAVAQMQLAQVRGSAGARMREVDAGVQAAEAQRDIAQAQLALLQAGAADEQVAVAGAAVAQAGAALEVARVALARCQVHAPFAGTIGAVHVRVGELVAPGQSLVTLGDLATLRVETTDLDEIDVARAAVDQVATVTFDALPERVFAGHVTRISPMADPGAGGVNYTVVVLLDETDPVIRWGMTAFVDIEVEK
jgi:multidrug efflux pump subunit AcrA (membrane-fusion protein)